MFKINFIPLYGYDGDCICLKPKVKSANAISFVKISIPEATINNDVEYNKIITLEDGSFIVNYNNKVIFKNIEFTINYHGTIWADIKIDVSLANYRVPSSMHLHDVKVNEIKKLVSILNIPLDNVKFEKYDGVSLDILNLDNDALLLLELTDSIYFSKTLKDIIFKEVQ